MILNKRLWTGVVLLGWATHAPALAQALAQEISDVQLPTIEVRGNRSLQSKAWSPAVENEVGKLKRGKNVAAQSFEATPVTPTQNYRYQFARTPGLLSSEVNNESFPSLGLRGLGDPHETQNLLLLEDGVPLAADMYGYPAQYYQPPFEWMDSSELYRGGGALLYGPLPAGALNYQMRSARVRSPLSSKLQFRMGSFDFKALNGEIMKSLGDRDAILIQGQNKSSDGFRNANSGFDMTRVRAQWAREFDSKSRMRVTLNHSSSIHGEPGGLAAAPGAGLLSITDNRRAVTLLNDHLVLERTMGVIDYQRGNFETKIFGGYFSRDSFRQNMGSGTTFGGVPTADSNTIQRQGFKTLAIDSRLKFEDSWLGLENTSTVALLLYGVDSPFEQETGATARATSGSLTKSLSRQTRVVSLALERRLEGKLGEESETRRWSLTPGVRLENIYQSIRENTNVGASVPLRSSSGWEHVALLGLGGEIDWSESWMSFANVSQSYKPAGFQEVVPLQTGDTVSGDLNPSRAWTAEVGAGSREGTSLDWKVSAFYIRYSDQFGRVGTVLQNTGAATHQGAEFSWGVPLLRSVLQGSFELTWVGNVMGLDARFDQGPLSGKTPQFAPKWLAKNSLLAEFPNRLRVALTQQFVADHFADDGNTANRRIPAYQVFDLTADARVLDSPFFVFAGVTNLFDREYTSRIRSNGIEPAAPRSFIFGASAEL